MTPDLQSIISIAQNVTRDTCQLRMMDVASARPPRSSSMHCNKNNTTMSSNDPDPECGISYRLMNNDDNLSLNGSPPELEPQNRYVRRTYRTDGPRPRRAHAFHEMLAPTGHHARLIDREGDFFQSNGKYNIKRNGVAKHILYWKGVRSSCSRSSCSSRSIEAWRP